MDPSIRRYFPLLLAAAGVLAYLTSLRGVFIYDDIASILENTSIRDLGNLPAVLSGPDTSSTYGRPLLNLSFAINRAIGGESPFGYHALNILCHIAGGLALYGIVRRTMLSRAVGQSGSRAVDADLVAFFVALLWIVHPVQTEAVTYIVQRAESMAGMFYLLTLYGFIRYADRRTEDSGQKTVTRSLSTAYRLPSTVWAALSIAACLFGMATKEILATAPVVVFLYDRTFVSGSVREAWKRHRLMHAGLAATWIFLAALVASTGGNRGGSVGFGAGVSPVAYYLTQFEAIAHYIRLAIWPYPLVFDYGTFWVNSAAKVIPYAVVVVALAAGTLFALWRRTPIGFLGGWFFAILAPTSLMPGTSQMIVEHRMYLSLAAILTLVVVGAYRWLGPKATPVLACVAVLFVGLSAWRNSDYSSRMSLWGDTVAKRPDNWLAHFNLGALLQEEKRMPEARVHYEATLKLKPEMPEAHNNLGVILLGRPEALTEAVAHFEAALKAKPKFDAARRNLADGRYRMGNLLMERGRSGEAEAQFVESIRLVPDYAPAHDNLGAVLAESGKLREALEHQQISVRLEPGSAGAQFNLGMTLLQLGQRDEAVRLIDLAVRLDPSFGKARADIAPLLRRTP